MGQYGVRLTVGLLVDGGGLHQGLAHELPRSDFSGLASSIWALAKAAAKETMDSLDRCRATALAFVAAIGEAAGKEIKADGTDPDRLARMPWPIASLASSGIRHLSSVLACSCLRWGLPGKDAGELRPGIGRAHIDNTDRLDLGFGRLNPE